MSKLFALESEDLDVEGVEMEVSPEEGEVASAQVEAEEGVGEVTEVADAVSDGLEGADQLEAVQEVVENAAEGDGLDENAAAAVKVAIECIAKNLGANPRAIYPLYAAENFQSASSRKANTKIALEGVSEFLKDLWKRIKAALKKMWEKVKAFWNKHLSSLGRAKKAIDSMKSKVKSSTGTIKGAARVTTGVGSLLNTYPDAGDVNFKLIGSYMEQSAGLMSAMGSFTDAVVAFAGTTDGSKGPVAITAGVQKLAAEIKGEKAEFKLVGGNVFKIEVDADEDGSVTIDLSTESDEEHSDEGRGVFVASKDEVLKVLDGTAAAVKSLIDIKKKIDKVASDTDKALNTISNIVERDEKLAPEDVKASRIALRTLYEVNAKTVKFFGISTGHTLKSVGGILSYANFCVKHYKAKGEK